MTRGSPITRSILASFFIFLLLSIIGSGLAQDTDVLSAISYGTPMADQARDIIPVSEGGYLIVGGTNALYEDEKRNGWLIRIDDQWAPLWDMMYGTQNFDTFRSAVEMDDGSFIILGDHSFGFMSSNAFLMKVNPDGTKDWMKVIYQGYDSLLHGQLDMVRTSDDEVLVSGARWIRDTEKMLWLGKYDTNGSSLWNKVFNVPGYPDGGELISTADGGFLLVSTVEEDSFARNDIIALKLDASGTREWFHQYNTTDSEFPDDVVELQDGGYVILSGGMDDDFDLYSRWRRLNVNGTSLDTRMTYGHTGHSGTDLHLTGNGDIITVGHSDYDLWMYRCGQNLTREWDWDWRGHDYSMGMKVIEGPGVSMMVLIDEQGWTDSDDILLLGFNDSGPSAPDVPTERYSFTYRKGDTIQLVDADDGTNWLLVLVMMGLIAAVLAFVRRRTKGQAPDITSHAVPAYAPQPLPQSYRGDVPGGLAPRGDA